MLSFSCYLFWVNLIIFTYCHEVREELCVDLSCTVPISQARGAVHYTADKSDRLSFRRGKEITIISKTKNEGDYWGAIIDGSRGYVPSHLVQELKVYHSTDKLIPVSVQQELNNETSKESQDISEHNSEKNPAEKNLEEYNIYDLRSTSDVRTKNYLRNDESETDIGDYENLNPKSNSFIMPNASFKVIEGTTVFDDFADQITPSAVYIQASASVETIDNTNSESQLNKNNVHSATSDPDSFPNININEGHSLSDAGSKVLQQEVNALNINDNNNNDDNNHDGNDNNDNSYDNNNNENGKSNDFIVGRFEDEEEEVDVDDGDNDDDDDGDDDDENDENDGDKDDVDKKENANNVLHESKDDNNAAFIINTENDRTNNNNNNNNNNNSGNNKTNNILMELHENNAIAVEKNTDVINESDPNKSGLEALPEELTTIKSSLVDKSTKYIAEKSLIQDEKMVSTIKKDSSSNAENSATFSEQIVDFSTETEANERESTISSTHKTNPIGENSKDVKSEEENINGLNDMSNLYSNLLSSSSQVLSGNQQIEVTLSDVKSEISIEETTVPSVNDGTLQGDMNENSVYNMKHDTSSDIQIQDTELRQRPSESSSSRKNEEKKSGREREETETLTTSISNDNIEVLDDSEADITVHEASIVSQVTDVFRGWFSSPTNEEKASLGQGNKHDNKVYDIQTNEENEIQFESKVSDSDFVLENIKDEESYWNYYVSDNLPVPSKTFIYLVVTAVTVLLFTLGHNFIEKKVKSGPLIAKINKLEQKLFVTSKECLQLKDEIQKAREKIVLYENSSNDELIVSLQSELEESKRARTELELSIDVLQQELDSATEAGLDLNKMLSEVLTQKGGSETLLESVENLQSQLNNQQRVIDEMTSKLGAKNEENESLQTALEAANEKIESLEDELVEVKSIVESHLNEKDSIVEDLKAQIDQLHSRINQLSESKAKELSKLKKQLEDAKKELKEKADELAVKEEEFNAIKQAVKQFKSKDTANLETLFDVSRVRAELIQAQKDNNIGKEELEKEKANKKILENRIQTLEIEVKKMTELCDSARQKEEEALKKLEVLSTYFKEKETQLQKELVCQEALWAQKKGDENAVYNMMKSIQEEVESYKSQNETLKKEILDQERGLKNQIAALEQKAHENWVAARQAERKLEESKQENAQLRNKLTLIEKSGMNETEGKLNIRSDELNGVEATSPVLPDASSPLLFPPLPLDPDASGLLPPTFMHPMFMPPPMTGFMPPPPFLPGDRRPPPLGRMSSPPLNSQFTPPPPPPLEYSFERMSPLAKSYRSSHEDDRENERVRHKSPTYPSMHSRNWDGSNGSSGFIPISSQRDSKREQKGAKASSEYSSSDSLDQSNKSSSRI